jgi:fatty-acyl-CoA synthase
MSSPTSDSATTVAGRMRARWTASPDRVVLRLLAEDGSATVVTGGELLARANAFAAEFARRGAERQPVCVALYHGLDLYAAFVGGLFANAIPSMLPPPSPRIEPAKYERSLRHMREYVDPAAIVLDAATAAAASFSGTLGPSLELLLDPAKVAAVDDFALRPNGPDDVILVQHSSGTTGLQKGVALSNHAVLAHNASYCESLGITEADVVVSWLPLYHDMGFIACFLLPLLEGCEVVAMSPFDWVRRPSMLLEAIDAHRGTLCWLPNFAFSSMANTVRPSQLRADLDLSTMRAWVDTAEQVRDSSLRAFVARFAPYGVTAAQLAPSYGMAENVFAITQARPGGLRTLHVDGDTFRREHRAVPVAAEAAGATPLVSCGPVIRDTEVRVADKNGEIIQDDRIGEIELRGKFLFSGYFKKPDLAALAMTPDGWYRSGDYGFIHGGEVFVTGRKKDLVIIQGRNFYPNDIEAAVGGVAGVIPGRVAAFGMVDERGGTEALIVVAETAEEAGAHGALGAQIRALVAQEFDCTPADVRLVPPRWLVKTSSGKVARSDNAEKYRALIASGAQTESTEARV